MALQFAHALEPVREVRPNLDVVPGGPALAVVASVAATAGQTGIDLRANLDSTLDALCEVEQYELVLIDSGPGDAPLLDALLGTARYLLVPTKDDDASLSGVELLALRYMRARQAGSAIQLLGVVLFDTNPRATARNREVFEQVGDLLEGSGADPFEAFIRSDRAAAVDLRTRHLTPLELVHAADMDQKNRLQRLRQKSKPGERLWSRDPSGLASDYQSLTKEILSRVARAERDYVPGGAA